jgi:sterol 14alpha-demethylase
MCLHYHYTLLLQQLLHNCMRESLRLFPPLIMLMRYAKQPFDVTADGKQYTVPKGKNSNNT